MLKLNVRFIKRVYGVEDGDFSVISAETVDAEGSRLVRESRYGNFTVAGNFAIDDDEIGDVFKVTIEEDSTSRFPNSYKFIKIHYEFPDNAKEQWQYLKSGNIVPLATYLSIEKAFVKSDKILDIIIEDANSLTAAKGIGESRAKLYHDKITKDADRAAIFAEFGEIEGVGHAIIKTLIDWKPRVTDTIKAVKKDPFSLLENESIGFMVADRFRAHYGLPLNDKNRILHGVMYFLNERFQNTGDTYEDIYEATSFSSHKLSVKYDEVITLLASVKDDKKAIEKYKFKIFGKNISTASLFNAELMIYKESKRLSHSCQRILPDDEWSDNKEDYLSNVEKTLSPKQHEFLDKINVNPVTVLLGPGGSGKSWITDIACGLINKAGLSYGLYAPTARAAHVMTEYTGDEALTIHRGLMKYDSMDVIVPHDVLIIDEYSMVDSELASVVLKAMGDKTRLIIIGDDFQLQSVGPGNVLFDLVNFIKVPTIRFTDIYRQSKGSGVLDYTQALREGVFNLPTDSRRLENDDALFINESYGTKQRDLAMKIYKKSLETQDIKEIMMLTPVNKGVSGRNSLNKEIQEIVNSSSSMEEIVFGENSQDESLKTYFRAGDYITVKKNKYEILDDDDKVTELINGDMGVVKSTSSKSLTFVVNDRSYTIDKSEINELIDHAWATTIHKAQGGQANIVIIVLPSNSSGMLNSNLLYTALSRAKTKVYVIGNFSSINEGARKQANFSRQTMIQLQGLNESNSKS